MERSINLVCALQHAASDGRLPRVLGILHGHAGRPTLALSCLLQDVVVRRGRDDAVRMAAHVVRHLALDEGTTEELQQVMLDRACVLDIIDRSATVVLLRALFGGKHEVLLPRLSGTPHLQLAYFRTLVETPSPSVRTKCKALPGISQIALEVLPPVEFLSEGAHGTYVQLLCALSPAELRPYLDRNDRYMLDAALRTAQEHCRDEGVAYLLEGVGNFKVSMSHTLEMLIAALDGMVNDDIGVRLNHGEGESRCGAAAAVVEKVDQAVSLCERCSPDVLLATSHRMWLEVVDATVRCQLHLGKVAQPHTTLARRIVRHVMRQMAWSIHGLRGLSSNICSQVVLRHIFEQHAVSLGDVRQLIRDAACSGHVEAMVLDSACASSSADSMTLICERRHALSEGRAKLVLLSCSRPVRRAARRDASGRLAALARADSEERVSRLPLPDIFGTKTTKRCRDGMPS